MEIVGKNLIFFFRLILNRFRSIDIQTPDEAIALFQKWVEGLTDAHFSIRFGSRVVIGSKKRNPINPRKSDFYSSFKEVKYFNHNLINIEGEYLGNGYRQEYIFGSIYKERGKKNFYIGEGFVGDKKTLIYLLSGKEARLFGGNSKALSLFREKLSEIDHSYIGIMIDMRYNPGGIVGL